MAELGPGQAGGGDSDDGTPDRPAPDPRRYGDGRDDDESTDSNDRRSDPEDKEEQIKEGSDADTDPDPTPTDGDDGGDDDGGDDTDSNDRRSSPEEKEEQIKEGSDADTDPDPTPTDDDKESDDTSSDDTERDDRRSSPEDKESQIRAGSDNDTDPKPTVTEDELDTEPVGESDPGTDDLGDSPQERNFQRLQEMDTSTPEEGQGAGAEVFGTGFVGSGGDVLSETEAEQRAEERFAGDVEGLSAEQVQADVTESGDVTFELTRPAAEEFGVEDRQIGEGEFATLQEVAERAEQDVLEDTQYAAPTDVVIREEGGELEGEFTASGRERLAATELGVDPEDINLQGDEITAETEAGEDALGITGRRIDRSRDMDRAAALAYGDYADLAQEAQQAQGPPEEQFGDFGEIDVTMSTGTGISQFTVEDVEGRLRGQAEAGRELARGFAETVTGGLADYEGTTGTGISTIEGNEAAQQRAEDFTFGAAQFVSAPADVGVTSIELAELGSYSADQIFGGETTIERDTGPVRQRGEVVGETGDLTIPIDAEATRELGADIGEEGVDRAQSVFEYARENPAELAGIGAGSLVGSTAIMGAAGRASTTAGRASRLAIQPGEEIAGIGGFRATRALRDEATAQRYFPNQEPLIFSEEAALQAAGRARARVQGLEFEPTARQRALGERFSPGAEGEFQGLGQTETGEVTAAGRSEPLGGAGTDVTTELYDPARFETETETEPSVTQRAEATAREFAADERGMTRLVSPEQEFETDPATTPEVEEPGSSFDLRQDVLTQRQDYLRPMARREFEARREQFEDFGTEAERRRAAERAEARTETGRGPRETEVERAALRADPYIGTDVGSEALTDVFADLGSDVDYGLDQRQDARFETEIEQEAEQEFEPEFRPEVELEPAVETEVEQEFETEFEPRTEFQGRREIEGRPEPETGSQGDFEAGLFDTLRGERLTEFLDPLTGRRRGD